MQASLIVRRGAAVREVVPLDPGQRVTIGRASTNRIEVSDEKCSRQHCEIVPVDGRWRLRDLGSRNGTHVAGQPIDEIDFPPGTVAEIGDWRVELTETLNPRNADTMDGLAPAAQPDGDPVPLESDSFVLVERKTGSRFDTDSVAAEVRGRHDHGPSSAEASPADALARLYVLAEKLADADSIDALARQALDGLTEATEVPGGCIVLAGGTTGEGPAEPVASTLPDADRLRPLVDYLTRIVSSTGDGCRFEDTNPGGLVGAGVPLRGAIASPIRTGEGADVVGAVILLSMDGDRPLRDSDLEFALTVATRVARRRAELLGVSEIRESKERAEQQAEELREQLGIETDLVGNSAEMDTLRQTIGRIARTEATVLIRGESGVGKELVARAVHFNSNRRTGPLVCVNCAALTETLLESELFGHEKGSFTGATARKSGKFEMAHRGTIFLDEVGEMSPEIQAKFLRVLEGHPFERVGGSEPITTDVRMVCATNRDLERAVEEGEFRSDLYYRLHVIQLDVPPLRERFDDIPEIAQHFVERYRAKIASKVRGFTPEAMQRLMKYPWPGNVRELRNVVERAVILADGDWLTPKDITLTPLRMPSPLGETADEFRLPEGGGDPFPVFADEGLSLDAIEERYVRAALQHTDWNKSAASRLLQIERTTLDRKIKKYDIQN